MSQEQQALEAFLGACKDHGLSGAKMKAAMLALFVPEGWALVPVEATDEQWDAGLDYNPDQSGRGSYIKGLYRAMVEAGPNIAVTGSGAVATENK